MRFSNPSVPYRGMWGHALPGNFWIFRPFEIVSDAILVPILLNLAISFLSTPSDIDECFTDTDTCHVNATCSNTDGSFTCSCQIGYTGDGMICDGQNTRMLLVVHTVSLENLTVNYYVIHVCVLHMHRCRTAGPGRHMPPNF